MLSSPAHCGLRRIQYSTPTSSLSIRRALANLIRAYLAYLYTREVRISLALACALRQICDSSALDPNDGSTGHRPPPATSNTKYIVLWNSPSLPHPANRASEPTTPVTSTTYDFNTRLPSLSPPSSSATSPKPLIQPDRATALSRGREPR